MKTQTMAILIVTVFAACSAGAADGKPDGTSLMDREAFTDNWFGLGRKLEDHGIRVGLGLTQAYQVNLHGGLATHRRAGRYTGSYDLEFELEPATLLNLPALAGGTLYARAEGSWSDGIDDSSVGSLFGVNSDAAGDRTIDIAELSYQQEWLDGRVRLRVGKLDLTGCFECRGCAASFDGNAFANDETGQFLNGALINNPTIPFPDCGLGAMLYVEPTDGFYFAAGVADGNADARETGFRSACDSGRRILSVYETGLTGTLASPNGPLAGAYRLGFWLDCGPTERVDGNGARRGVMGLYLSCDQMLWNEGDANDGQGLGAFFRYGLADSDTCEVKAFYSGGVQYQGLLPGRDEDVAAIGFATGTLSRQADLTADSESVFETYYSIRLTGWLSVAPSMQVVFRPGSDADADEAIVLGVRCQMSF